MLFRSRLVSRGEVMNQGIHRLSANRFVPLLTEVDGDDIQGEVGRVCRWRTGMSERGEVLKHVTPFAGIDDLSTLCKEQDVSKVWEQVRSTLVDCRDHRSAFLS